MRGIDSTQVLSDVRTTFRPPENQRLVNAFIHTHHVRKIVIYKGNGLKPIQNVGLRTASPQGMCSSKHFLNGEIVLAQIPEPGIRKVFC